VLPGNEIVALYGAFDFPDGAASLMTGIGVITRRLGP
jgi:hypothetical protein